MSHRTQIYLTDEQKKQIDEIRKRNHISLAQLIRQAVDKYVIEKKRRLGLEEALEISAGAWKHRDDIKSGSEYTRKIRREAEERLKRYGIR
jgi:hypothetical protein